MYVIVTEKKSSDIQFMWLCDHFELTDAVLVCQNGDEVTTYEDFNDQMHDAVAFLGEVEDGFDVSAHKFVDGVISAK
jgi:hypothetical protein